MKKLNNLFRTLGHSLTKLAIGQIYSVNQMSVHVHFWTGHFSSRSSSSWQENVRKFPETLQFLSIMPSSYLMWDFCWCSQGSCHSFHWQPAGETEVDLHLMLDFFKSWMRGTPRSDMSLTTANSLSTSACAFQNPSSSSQRAGSLESTISGSPCRPSTRNSSLELVV